MTKKTIIIFISVFIIVGLFFVLIFSSNKDNPTRNQNSSWYQVFNPFKTGLSIFEDNDQNQDSTDTTDNSTQTGSNKISKFFQVTSFPVAGAVYILDKRPIQETLPQEERRIPIDPTTKKGRQEIQAFLNEALSLKLVTDGNFGKLTIDAIKEFQKIKGLDATGKVDEKTAPYFTKTDNLLAQMKYEFVPTLRYVERMNGHLYRTDWTTKETEKISNSTIPSIYEAYIGDAGESVIYRYLSNDDKIITFLATLGSQNGEFLVENISDVSISEDRSKFFYLVEGSTGVTGLIGKFDGQAREIVFNSPFTEWLSQWSNNQKIYLTPKASYMANGSLYLLNTTNKSIQKIFGGIKGLTTLVNHNASLALYGSSTPNGPKLGVYNITNNSIKDLDSYGLPEKCVWSKDNINIYCGVPNQIIGNQYPDVWYQGLVSFDDFFVKINTITGEKITLADSADEIPIDATRLFLDDKEESLFFINKKDLTLWELKIQ